MSENKIIPVDEVSRNAFASRLREAMGADSQRTFGDKIGVGQATVRQYLSGATEPSWSTLMLIAHACGRSVSWLMTGVDDAANTEAPYSLTENYIAVSRFSARASAGYGERVFDEPPASFWQVPREMLRGFSGNSKHLASTDISGDSMEPTLHDGEPVIFDRSSRQVDREGVYVLTVGDDLFVKRVRRVPQGDGTIALELISDNPAYEKITLAPDAQDHVRIHGHVIWPSTSRRL